MRGAVSLTERDGQLEWPGLPAAAALRRAVRHELRRLEESLQVIAEDFLAERTAIDLLARGSEGELVSIRIGRSGEDASLLTCLLADCAWLAARTRSWLALAPELDLDPTAPVRGLLLCPDFRQETRTASTGLADRPIRLLQYRCLQQQGQLAVLLDPLEIEPLSLPPHRPRRRARPTSPEDEALEAGRFGAEATGGPTASAGAASRRHRPPPVQPRRRLTDPPRPSCFRTGLTEADLRPSREAAGPPQDARTTS